MDYSTPSELVDFLKRTRISPYAPGERQGDFDAITKRDLEKHGIPFEPGSKGIENFESIILQLFADILSTQPEEIQKSIETSVSVGVMETGLVNAFIANGGGGCYAVIVNSGLMILLNKALKLWVGGARKGGIIYCNRKPAEELSNDNIHEMLHELFSIYKETGIPRGPMVKVSDECLGTYSMALHLAEAFVVCHELGHYLNGDLNSNFGLASLPWCDGVEYYKGDSNHEKEHNADITGYGLLQRFVHEKHSSLDDNFLMFAIVTVMAMIGAISAEGSSTHPDAKDRVIRIARHFYGDEEAEKWEASYKN
jgi:hypothetical protein